MKLCGLFHYRTTAKEYVLTTKDTKNTKRLRGNGIKIRALRVLRS